MSVARVVELLALAAVAGAGLTGLAQAARLARRGVSVLAVDRERSTGEIVADLAFVLGMGVWVYGIGAAVLGWPWPLTSDALPAPALALLVARVAGLLAALTGCALYMAALARFGRSWRLGIDRETADALVTEGVFAHSRNPVYLALSLLALGASLAVGRVLPLALACGAPLYFRSLVAREEAFLARHYGEAYARYCERVPRWWRFSFAEPAARRPALQWLAIALGPALALCAYALLPDTYTDPAGGTASLGHAGRATAAIAVWMASWWITQAISLYATALLPLALLPLCGATSMRAAAAPYAHELIFLFMGGFILALSMQRWGLDRRLSLSVLAWVGTRPETVVAGFMLLSAGLSMWVSNTATVVMMFPIALGVIELIEGESVRTATLHSSFSTCLLLGIAYASSIGGVGTIIGTPPNLFLVSYLADNQGIEISFVRWMSVGVPLVALFLPLVWWLLTRVLHPIRLPRIEGGRAHLREARAALGPVAPGEWATLTVFALTAAAWLTRTWLVELEWAGTRPLAGLTDPGIAMLAAVALFLIPVDRREARFAMDWDTARALPWGLLVLFGGGLSLAAAIRTNGVGEYLGASVTGLGDLPPLLVIGVVVTLIIFLTEITSNTATAATLIPVLASMAPGLRLEPLLLVVPAAIAASCAFMLPVATPPNAVAFGSGRIELRDMVRAGLILNGIGVVLITGLCYALVGRLLGAG